MSLSADALQDRLFAGLRGSQNALKANRIDIVGVLIGWDGYNATYPVSCFEEYAFALPSKVYD